MHYFMTFFRNADSIRVISSCTGPGAMQAESWYISCIFEAKFFINGAIRSAILLAHAAFASVNSSSRPSETKNSSVESMTNCATLLQHNLELTMTVIKTGAVGINHGHWKLYSLNISSISDSLSSDGVYYKHKVELLPLRHSVTTLWTYTTVCALWG